MRRWLKKWREEVVDRYGLSCAAGPTGCQGPLACHHIKYRSQGGLEDWQNGLMLCTYHHQLVHQRRVLIQRSWLRYEAQKYLAEIGWVDWDEEGQTFGRGLRGFAPSW